VEKILGIVQENNGFGFAAFGTPLIAILQRPSAYPPAGARAFARQPRGIGLALFLAYKVVLE
jgi:hypothetical protein